MNDPVQRRTVLLASGGALLLAAALLLAVILPAEYGWDPLGTGTKFGLLGMTGEESSPLNVHSEPWRTDRIEFQLAPFEAVEYKYRLKAGTIVLYHWAANAEVLYDMHAEPDGAAPGYAESFSKARADHASGSYTAPFDGIHGWYWHNRSRQDVTLTLETSGFYAEALEMRDGREFRYGIEAQPRNAD